MKKKRLNKKLIIFALILILVIFMGAVNAAENQTDKKVTNDNPQKLSSENNVRLSSSNETTLGADIEFSGSTFSELESTIHSLNDGDVLILKNDIINDGSEFIRFDKSITVEGNGHVIDAANKSGIFFLTADNVVLNNIVFINANNSDYGGAIFWIGNNGVISNSVFYNNYAHYGTQWSGYGGAIDWCQGTNGKIYNCQFYNNYAELSGGAIRAKSDIVIDNSIFSYNSAQNGGAVYVIDQAQDGNISNSRFTFNYAEDKGGAMYFTSNVITVIDNYFTQNSAKYGGAVYATSNGYLFFDQLTVIANFAEYGGGFYLSNPSWCPIKVRYSTFLNNTAYKIGAGVYCDIQYDQGYSEVDALNSDKNTERNTVHGDKGYLTWEISSWQNPVTHTYFGGSIDNYIGVDATPNETTVVIDVSIPKDAEKSSAYINLVIKDESGVETTYVYDPSDSRWNYDEISHSAKTIVSLTLTDQKAGNYNVTATFKDNLYYTIERKGNTTYTIEGALIKGNFTILQELIDEAISSGTYVIDLDRDYTYSIGLDHGQMNIYDKITINGNGHFLDALGYCRIFAISGDDVVLNNIVFTNGKSSGIDGTLEDDESGGAIFICDVEKITINNCTFTMNDATDAGAIFCTNSSDVYIHDTIFTTNIASTNGGAIYLLNNLGSIEISNCTLSHNSANRGGAINCNSNNCNISDCTFIDNTAVYGGAVDCYNKYNVNVTNCNFVDNTAYANGGAIDWWGINSLISGCNFTNNDAAYGGAISTYNAANIVIANSKFTDNHASENGGAIEGSSYNSVICDCTFQSNHAKDAGALSWNSAHSSMYNCNFTDNYASNTAGVFAWQGNEGDVHDCIFKNNHANNLGVAFWSGSDSKIYSCNFTDNYANDGGAIQFWQCNNIELSDSNFTNNSAKSGDGGAVIFYSCNDCNISDSNFIDNVAEDQGGAIYWSGNNGRVYRSNFKNNNATFGSAINWDGSNGKLISSTFLDNRADAVSLLLNDADLSLTLTFVGNDNYINAIYSPNYDLTFEDVTYYNGSVVNSDAVTPVKSINEVGQSVVLEFYAGGVLKHTITGKTDSNGQFKYDYSVLDCGVYTYKAYHNDDTYYTYIANESDFKFGEFDLLQHEINKADDDSVLILIRNYTYTIGVDTITDGVVINKRNLTINGNNHVIDALYKSRIFYVTSENVVLNNMTYRNGTADMGGAIYADTTAANLVISNATFRKNTADTYGGAVYWDSPSGNINHAVFEENYLAGTDTSGGAIYWNAVNCNISYSSFLNNYAESHGGALYSNADKTTLDYVNFTSSHSIGNGGAVWIKSDSSITNSNFIENYAWGSGGAIWCDAGETTVSYSNFTLNHANGANGGALLISGSSANIDHTNFNGDYAINDGGSVYISTSNGRIDESTFKDSHAVNGGAVYWEGQDGTIYNTTFTGTYSRGNGGAVCWVGNKGNMDLVNFSDINAEGSGGAVYWSGNGGKITNANFIESAAISGGAIYWAGNEGVVTKSTFVLTESTSSADTEGGGAIHWKSLNGNITYCNFTRASASFNGGAIFVGSAGATITNVIVTNSRAVNNGGAIYIAGAGVNAKLSDISMFKNSASNGGGLYVNAKDATFTNSVIANSSATNGGGMSWLCSGGIAENILLENNSARDGGALFARSKNGDTAATTFTHITFNNNDATRYGGAICFNKDAGGYSIYDSTFTDNTATTNGNSIYYYQATSEGLNNSVYNSDFTGTNHIYIENNMRATLENNKELNSKNGDYFVYNKGIMALSNNSLRNLIVNYGTILTQVNVTVCDNKTYTFDDFYFPLNATAVDDNGNTVVSNSLVFTTNHDDNVESEIDEDMHTGTLITNKEHYVVNITDAGLKKVYVKIAIINVIAKLGSYTWLQKEIDNLEDAVYVLTRNVTFYPEYDLSIYNIYYGKIDFSKGMNYNKTFTLQGANFTISGLNQARIFDISVGGVVINNTNFINGSSIRGGALYITSDNVEIANSTFIHNWANSGGAISSISNSDLNLNHLSFINNTASNIAAVELLGLTNSQISNLNFINNSATNDCGALSFTSGSDIQTLNDCYFENNAAGNDYGAAYVFNVNVDSCNFVNNTAKADYSALYLASSSKAVKLTSSNFTGNYADNSGTVGIENANAKVNDCIFTENKVKSSGSAIYVNAHAVEISNSVFDKNIAGANGTVWFASDSGKISRSNFTSNKASNGAGIYTSTDENIIIDNSVFVSNIASLEAGAIYFASQSGQIQYCNFTNNAALNGGAIVIAGSGQDIGYCNFEGNNATSKGGSIYVKNVLNNNVHDSTFKNSNAFDGGAVYNSGSTGASLRLFNDTFIRNIASHNGGAVYYIVDADGTNPVIYRDYLNFTSDGITSDGVVDPVTGRTTVTMKSAGSTYQRIVDCKFVDNQDYLLNISARTFQDTLAVVYITNPKDADEKSVRIIITVSSTDGSYYSRVIINETNFDYYFNTYSQSFAINFNNLTEDMDYNVTVSFEDVVYLYKLNSTTFHIGHGDKEGDFKYLQRLINEAIAGASPGEIPTLDLPRNIIFTIGTEVWCDDWCINITSPITINGLGYTIDALNQARIFNITSDDVTLNNIKFVHGNSGGVSGDGVDKGGAIFWSGEKGSLMDCEFRTNVANVGGAIYYSSTASNAKVSGSYFFNNTAVTNGGAIDCNASEMNLTNTLFESNYAGEYGAALCRESSATGGFGRNNNFTSNDAGKAGAALAWLGVDNIKINNYIFIDNTAGENGGAIYVDSNSDNCKVIDCIFEGNNVTDMTGGSGGAIDWLGANGTVLNSNFTNNNAYEGGAIFVGSSTGNTNITGSTFTKNNAINNGGAINLVASAVTVNASNFYDNSAVNGGALYVGGEGTTNHVYSSVFENNSANGGRGGAINWVASTGEIIDSNFTNNSAEYGGGVYFGLKSKGSKIENVIFTGNSANKNGGAIDWNSTDGELYNTQFVSNYAGEYGAALCREANATGGHGNNNSFTSNHAGIAGAALAWMDSVGISITNYTFKSNIADERGGAIYINPNSHNCSIIECSFDSNEVYNLDHGYGGAIDCESSNVTVHKSSFTNNFAFEGGAIHVGSNSGHTNITDSIFSDNRALGAGGAINLEASSVTVNNSQFRYNMANDGGALYVGGESLTNYVYNSCFEFNDASSGHGGAIGWLSSTGHIVNSNFTSNTAEYGGAVYLNGNSSDSQIVGSRFIGNAANTNGGAIDWNATSGDLKDNYFFSNYAGEYGGALCRESNATSGHGYNNTFESNFAEIAGGGIAWMAVANIKIDTYYFYNNMAGYGGGAIYVGYGSDNSTIVNCDFKGNNITGDTGGYGGAIYCVAENTTINNTNFTDNEAFYGGAICVDSGSGHTNITDTNFINNFASISGGALYLKSSSVLNNTVFKRNVANIDGGAVFVDGVSDNNYIFSSVFENNYANEGRGGAINWGSSAGRIVDSNFTLNAAMYGGGVYLGGNSFNSQITNVIFSNNTATYNGGAIDWNATGGNLTNTVFKYNHANLGAALCREANATGGYGYNNTFDSNHAYTSGAALAWLGVNNITIRKYTFINNTADYSGGAIYVAQGSDNCKVINSTFVDNYVSNAVVGRGGAIDWIGNNAYIFNTTFSDSFSPNGGAIYIDKNSNNATIIDSSFTSCISLSTGGAIQLNGVNSTIRGSNFTSSLALMNGAAIAGLGADNTNISDCIFRYGVVAGYTDTEGNERGEGGAVYWENATNIVMSNSKFIFNEARANGGSIAAIHCDDAVLNNLSFYNDTSVENGGSISWMDSKNLVIESNSFKYTSSVIGGGAICLENVTAQISNSDFYDIKSAWGYGGAIYVDGDVVISNSTFDKYFALNDNATAIYFKSGTSTLFNSTLNGKNPIYIDEPAIVTLTKNNVTESSDGHYSVYNNGTLYLEGNSFDNIILNGGIIKTQTYTYVLSNNTWNATVGEEFGLWVKIVDDTKNNLIVSVDSLYFDINGTQVIHGKYDGLKNNTALFTPTKQGQYIIGANDAKLEKNEVFIGILNAKTKTHIDIVYSQTADGNNVTFTATVTLKDQFDITGNVTFKLGDKILGISEVINGIANLTVTDLIGGTYRITAIYGGDEYYLGCENEVLCNINLRTSWIIVAINNTLYGQNATVLITTNSNGTVRFNLHGREEVIEVPIVNGRGEFNLTLSDYETTGKHSVGVVLESNQYYVSANNQTSFIVYKHNTTIVVNPTPAIYSGDKEVITVTVNDTAKGFVKVTINGKHYYEELNGGIAKFEIYNLTRGKYRNVEVEYLGDEYFNGNSTVTSFDVNLKTDYVINVRTNNVKYGENVTIYASLPSDVTKNIVFIINGTPYPEIKIVNGVAELTIPNLDVGEYPVVVVYNGDDKYDFKFNQTSFNVTATDNWALNLTVEPHTYGQDTIFNVTLPENVTKNVNLTIDGINYTVVLTNGTGILTLNNISGGLHSVVAYYAGDDRYLAKTNSTLFFIEKAESMVNITSSGRNLTATVTTNATGWVKFIVNGNTQRVRIVDGNATWENALIEGNNFVVAFYEGDINFTDSNNFTSIDTALDISYVNVTATNVTYGNASMITVNVPISQKGYVRIVVNGTDINAIVEIKNGIAKFNATGLDVGRYLVNVTYLGDEVHDIAENFTYFNITKADLTASVIAQNVTVKENTSFVVNVNDNFAGRVNITVDGVVHYSGDVGSLIYINKLPAGDYVANVTFYGDDNYNVTSLYVDFNVSRVIPIINVTVADVTYPDNATAIVNISDLANGTVVIDIGDKHFSKVITNGHVEINLTGLSAGIKEANITFTTSDDFNFNGTATVKFNVNKKESTVILTKEENNIVATVSAGATGNVTFFVNGKKYVVDVNGEGRAVLVNALLNRDNSIVAIYNGDENFTTAFNSTNQTRAPEEGKVNVTAQNVTYGNVSEITVKVPADHNGYVRIVVNGTDIDVVVEINNGVAKFNATGLNVARYMVNVTYLGDDVHDIAENFTYFNITKADLTASVIAQNVTVDENASFIIYVIDDFKGQVRIEVDGKVYDGDVKTLLEVAKLKAGTKNAVVTFYGDDNYNVKVIEPAFTVSAIKPTINVTIAGVTYPNNTTAIVKISGKANGTVEIKVGTKTYTKQIINGEVEIPITDLDAGLKEAIVYFNSTDDYNSDVNTTYQFFINKTQSNIEINVTPEGLYAGDDAIINITVSCTGEVTVYLDGVENKDILDNNRIIINKNNLSAGEHTVVVYYPGDNNYESSSKSYTFRVDKRESKVNVTVQNTPYKDTVQITVQTPTVQSGYVTITINNENYTKKLENGIAKFNVTGLKVDKYTVNVTYEGDENYTVNENSTTFNVTQIDLNPTVIGVNVTKAMNSTFIIVVPSDYEGQINITVDGETYIGDAKSIIQMAKLDAGEKVAHVEFLSDNNYKGTTMDVSFTVSKSDDVLVITEVVTNSTIVITVPENVTGNATIILPNGTNQTIVITNGSGVINLENITPGDQNITVIYSDGENNITTNITVTIPKYDSEISVGVSEVKSGESATVTVNVPINATGTITVTIDGVKYTTDNITGGVATITTENLTAGSKTIVVEYSGDANYSANYTISNFTVGAGKVDSDVTVVDHGNGTIVIVVGDNATGNVTVKVGNETFNATVINGTAIVEINNVTPGTHEIEVIYSGDGNHTNVTMNTTITAPKYDTPINVTVSEVKSGENATVTVNVPVNATGTIKVTIDGVEYTTDNITGGVATITTGNLTEGLKTIVVEYFGDDNFTANYTISNFTVGAGMVDSDMTVVDYGNGTVVVVVSGNATGNVTVKVGDDIFNATVINGTAIVEINNVTPGVHEVEVIYSGDDTHSNVTMNANITAPKYDSFVNVTVGEAKEGEPVVVTVNVPVNATGNVTVSVGGKEYVTDNITNGVAVITVDSLPAGNTTIVVEYFGDDNYSANYTISNFTIESGMVNPDMTVVDYGNGTVVIVVGDNATGNVTVKVGDDIFNATVINGTAVVEINNVTPGTHEVEVIYSGDDTHSNVTVNTTITAPKYDTSINITIGEAKEGEPVVVTVNVPVNATGNVTVSVGGKEYVTDNITDGVAVITVDSLPAGDTTIVVEYSGDSNYAANYAVSNFTIESGKVDSEVTVVDHGNGTIVIVVGDNATGNVTVKVGNETFNATVINGTAIVEINNVTPGTHEVEVIYSGDGNHTNVTVNTTITAPKYDSSINITIGEAKEGEPVVVTVNVPVNATGNVTVSVGGKEYVTDNITNGVAVITVDSLPAGDTTIVVEYSGDDNYAANYAVSNFTVESGKVDSEVIVIDQGNGTVIIVVGDNATGNVTVKVGDEIFNADVVNGTAAVTLDDVTPGSHEVEVIYSGDANHSNATVTANITAPKYDTSINITVGEAKAGEPVVITVNVPVNATGNVTVSVGGKEYVSDDIRDGVAVITVDNLTAGDTTIVVEYSGDDNYAANYAVSNFTVESGKVDSEVIIVDHGNGTIVVVVGDNATGNVTVKVGNETFNATVINGTAVVEINNVTPGTHDIEVIYSGDGNHTNATANTTISVSNIKPSIKIEASNINVGDKAIINVFVSDGVTGDITIEIDGVNYTKPISGGVASFEVENLTAGLKSVFAVYAGNGDYAEGYAIAQFNVSKVETGFNVTIKDVNVGENVTVVITLPDDATGQILIDIDGVGYYANVTNGVATAHIPYLPSGTYNVDLTYTGDEKYTLSSNKTVVKVQKMESFVIPIAYNIQVGENEIIKLIVPTDATGTVTILIDSDAFNFNLSNGALGTAYVEGEKYSVAISGGKGEITISGLPKGEYVVSVKYNGDHKYLPSTNSTIFTVSKIDTTVDVVDYGNGTVKVILPKDATGNVTVKVDNETYVVPVENGTAVITLNSTSPGTHKAEIIYSGDNDYSSKTVNATVDVPKYDAPISVSVDDIRVGDTAVVTVNVPKDAEGYVTIEIDGVEYSTKVSDGKATFNIKNLSSGSKTVAVTYSGDKNYLENFTTGQFKVLKRTSSVSATPKDITTGKDEVITVTVPKDATGRVLVNIDGVGYYGTVENGKAKVIIPNLEAGKYKATVIYEGDDKYLPSTTTTSFKVTTSSTPISAIGDEITVGEDAVVVIDLPEDATGTVTIEIAGKTFTTDVIDGKASFVIPGLTVGVYPVLVYYSGDVNYPSNETITYVIVNEKTDGNDTPISSSVHAEIGLSKYPTGNPILMLLFALLTLGSGQIIRKIKK